MNLIDILERRYSTKQFDPTKQISAEDMAQIKALLRLSPSSVNAQPWHFILADSESGKARVAKGTEGEFQFNRDKVLHSALSVVFCVRSDLDEAYMQKLSHQEEADGRYAKPEYKAIIHRSRNMFTDIHKTQFNDLSHWMEKQVYLNMGGFLLGVAALGLDAVPMEGVDVDMLNREFGLPEKGFRAVGVVCVGYRCAQDFNAGLPKSRLPEADIFTVLK